MNLRILYRISTRDDIIMGEARMRPYIYVKNPLKKQIILHYGIEQWQH